MKITDIKKTKNKYQLTIESLNASFIFEVDEEVIIQFRLLKNKELDECLYQEIIKVQEFYKFYHISIKYLRKRASRHDVKMHLIKQNCPKEIIETLLDKLQANRLIDDTQFAEILIKTLVHKGYGRNVIVNKLNEHFISQEEIFKLINNIEDEIYIFNINKLGAIYIKNNSKKPLLKLKIDLKNYLLTRGFQVELIHDYLNQISIPNNDEKNIGKYFEKCLKKYQKKFSANQLKTKIIQSLMMYGFNYQDIINYLEEVYHE